MVDVLSMLNGSKSGPIFANLYERWLVGRARRSWSRRTSLRLSSTLFLISRRLADVRTDTRRTRKEKEGLFARKDKEKSIFEGKGGLCGRIRSTVFCSVKRRMRLLHEGIPRRGREKERGVGNGRER